MVGLNGGMLMASLATRIGALERRLGTGDWCPECGRGAPPGAKVEVTFSLWDDPEPPPPCPRCGAPPITFTMRLGETTLGEE